MTNVSSKSHESFPIRKKKKRIQMAIEQKKKHLANARIK